MAKKDKYVIYKLEAFQRKKGRIPKWFNKTSEKVKVKHIFYYERNKHFPNNEERILIQLSGYSVPFRIDRIAKETNIDYRNISRYLKSLEKRKLIEIKDNYNLIKQKSGIYKYYHYKEIYMTEKGEDFIRDKLGFKH